MPKIPKQVEQALRSVLTEAANIGEQKLIEAVRNWKASIATMSIGEGKEDPFTILGVSPTDPPDLIDQVYRAKAKYYHPDTKDTGDPEAFKRISNAYTAVLEAIKIK